MYPLLGYSYRHRGRGAKSARGQLHRFQREISARASRKKCRKRHYWPFVRCLSSCSTRPHLLEEDDGFILRCQGITPPHPCEPGLQVGPVLVGPLPGALELSLFTSVVRGPPAATFTSDASGTWGCGAFISTGEWFQLRWPQIWKGVHITVKELLPIVVACAIWGHLWRGKTVHCLCDNVAIVAIIRSGTSKHPRAMHLMRCLFFFTASYQVYLVPKHLPGKLNRAVDSLSRGNLPSFFQQVPAARHHPTQIPHPGIGATATRLDVGQLEDRAAFYFAQGLADSTQRTYQSGHNRYLQFCRNSGSSPLPLTESVLCLFVSHLADSDLKFCIIKTCLASAFFKLNRAS